jgi:dolichol-phosphate mannosyltransferase
MTDRANGQRTPAPTTAPLRGLDGLRLPQAAFCPVFTREAIGVPLHVDQDGVVAWVGYLHPELIPPGIDVPTVPLRGSEFARVSTLATEPFAACVDRAVTVQRLPGLGKLCRLPAGHVTGWLPTRSPAVTRDNASTLALLVATLDVPEASIGLTGSTLYRPAPERSDIDFVVYGHHSAQRAACRVRRILPSPESAYVKTGVVQHLRFRVPGHREWFDPRFAVADPLTGPLLDGRAVRGPVASVGGLTVTDDTDGIYHPARYRLDDGSVLASYRLGHCAYFQAGDRLGDTRLPTARLDGTTYRLVLGQEHIDRAPTLHHPTRHDRREVRAGPGAGSSIDCPIRAKPEVPVPSHEPTPPRQPHDGAPVEEPVVLPEPWATRAVTVVLPTYNEADNLPTIVEALLRLPLANLRVLVVDDNSPDGTGDLADKLAAEHNTPGRERVGLLRRPGKQGLGRAYVAGMTRALADGAEYVVQMDADLSHDPRHIPEMLGTLLSTRAGVVIGSRYTVSGSLDASWGLHRRLLSAWANFYVHLILGLHVRDVTAGYKLWHRDTLNDLDLDAVRSNGYSFQVEMNYRALTRGHKILEIPIHFTEREHGTSKMSFTTQLESALMPLRLRLQHRRR